MKRQVLKLPMAAFWLEADGTKIPFSIINVTDEVQNYIHAYNHHFNVNESYILKPELPTKFSIDLLAVKVDKQKSKYQFEDWISDEYYSGACWQFENSRQIVGVAGFVDNNTLDDHAVVGKGVLAGYESVNDKFRGQLLFQISDKDLKAINNPKYDDLSLDLSFDLLAEHIVI